ncbi:MAG TPA: zinc ribbon domain-containing protein [Pyrinomonadaceae bacterium]|nr:zinc ribbon domain-containing protein [Pyrinomonadaceae bacterium]
MAEVIVENRICNNCEADVRKGALFCYNCGSSVAPELPLPVEKNGNDVLFRTDDSVEENPAPITTKTNNFDKPIEKPAVLEEPKLKSAASLRKRPKSVQKKRVEIVWEEPESAPNAWFVLVGILLTLFAVGIWLLAMYLK